MSLTQIWQFNLRRGNSNNPRNGACLLDAVSWFEYGTLGDHPACVCPVIAAYARGINDTLSDTTRQRLKPFILRLPGTVDPAAEQERAEYLAWQAIRVFAPIALDAVGLSEHAENLRNFRGTLTAAAADAAAADAAAAAADAAAAAANAAAANAAAAAAYSANAAKAAKSAAACVANADAARIGIEDATISTLEGVLNIGRQAEPIPDLKIIAANRAFEAARA